MEIDIVSIQNMVMQFNEKMKSIHGEQEVDQIQHSKDRKNS